MSRAPRPAGRRPCGRPASTMRRQRALAASGGTKISNPSSPVYPVRATIACPPFDGPLGEVVERDPLQVDRSEGLEDRFGARSLECEQGELVAQVVEPAARRVLGEEPLPVLLDVRGVHDHEKPALGATVDDDVVHRAARGNGEGGVLRLPVHELRDVVGRRPLQEREGALPLDLELAHVGDVEEAGGGPHGGVLGDEARVLDGHVPPAEGHHPGPAFPVDGVERCLSELGHRTKGHAITGPRRVNEGHRLDSEGVVV